MLQGQDEQEALVLGVSAGHAVHRRRQQLRSLKPQSEPHSDRLAAASQHPHKLLRSPAAIFKALPMTNVAQTSAVAVVAVTVVAAATYAGYKYGYKGDALPTLPSVNLKVPKVTLQDLRAKLPTWKKAEA
ncbi:hypothetical protein ABPG77_008092 [Micractinium sp. CCAP 211/92]